MGMQVETLLKPTPVPGNPLVGPKPVPPWIWPWVSPISPFWANPLNKGEDEFLRKLRNRRKSCPIMAPLDPPWKDREKWPKNCQLDFQVPGPPGSGYDTCAYVCKGWEPKDTIRRPIRKGGTCPKWLDWIPDEVPS
jgi:hypothetical protein